jgi:2Fe-2S ferredoxin
MALITYIQHDGTEHEIDIPDGDSVMQGALNNGIDGIVGECGGALSCATCLCFVDPAWVDRIEPPSEMETQLLEFALNGDQPGARFSCQLHASDQLNGLIVRLPKSQF